MHSKYLTNNCSYIILIQLVMFFHPFFKLMKWFKPLILYTSGSWDSIPVLKPVSYLSPLIEAYYLHRIKFISYCLYTLLKHHPTVQSLWHILILFFWFGGRQFLKNVLKFRIKKLRTRNKILTGVYLNYMQVTVRIVAFSSSFWILR